MWVKFSLWGIMGLKILVTGGAGFIGSHLIDRLVERGDEVVCLDEFTDFYPPKIKRQNIEKHVESGKLAVVDGDICATKLISAVFERFRPQKVVHLAARVGVAQSVADPMAYEQVNVRGTLEILMQSVKYGVEHFIYGSSSSIYGNGKKLPLSEDVPARPISPYAATKRAGEVLCHTWHHLHHLPVTCLRFFTVHGPRQRPDMVIHKFVRLMDAGKPIQMLGDGSSRRDYTYVADIVQGIEASLQNVFEYQIINLGEARTVSLKELITALEAVTGKKATIEELPANLWDARETYADISKAKKLLGYNPQVPLEAGLEKFWEWYRKNRELLAGVT